jgi:hypothetical protein
MDDRPKGCLVDCFYVFLIVVGAITNAVGVMRSVNLLAHVLKLRLSNSIEELISLAAVIAGGLIGGFVASYLHNYLPKKR